MTNLERARKLRSNQTDAERRLWSLLRAGRFGGHKFRRQHPIGPYIVDFLCMEQSLVIEVDGNHHSDQVGNDEDRSRWLEGRNLRILRFSNREVLTELSSVQEAIWLAMDPALSPTLPLGGRGPEGEEGRLGADE